MFLYLPHKIVVRIFHASRTKFTTFTTVGFPLIEMQFNLAISYCNLATVSKNYRIIYHIKL